MKKLLSLWITQFLIVCCIILILYFFITNASLLLNLYSFDMPAEIKIEIYLWSFIRLLVLIIQISALYFSFRCDKRARVLTILAWLPIIIVMLWSNFHDGLTSLNESGISYDNDAQRSGGIIGKLILAGLSLWLTSIILFSKKLKRYFLFEKSE